MQNIYFCIYSCTNVVFGGRRSWYLCLWSELRVSLRLDGPKLVHQLSQQPNSSNLERNPAKAYFHILYSTFSYFIFCQTQFKTSFRLPPFIRGIHWADRYEFSSFEQYFAFWLLAIEKKTIYFWTRKSWYFCDHYVVTQAQFCFGISICSDTLVIVSLFPSF